MAEDFRMKHEVRCRERVTSLNNKTIIILLLPFLFAFAKVLVIFVLPDKYFYDSNRIVSMSNKNGQIQTWEGSYRVASEIFSAINVLHLDTTLQWSVLLGGIFTIITGILILNIDEPDIIQTIYILSCVVLLNIYVFTIGKDIIQFCILCLIVISVALPFYNRITIVLIPFVLLCSEYFFFKQYYIGIAFVSLLLFYLFVKHFFHGGLLLLKIVISMLVIIGMLMLVLWIFVPSLYTQIATVRYMTNIDRLGSADAQSIISDIFMPSRKNDSPLVFMANYVINLLRMMFPIELLMRGALYWLFCLFQLATTYYLYRSIRVIERTNDAAYMMVVSIYLSFILISALFEPDFGSWVRHETSVFPIVLLIVQPFSSFTNTMKVQ